MALTRIREVASRVLMNLAFTVDPEHKRYDSLQALGYGRAELARIEERHKAQLKKSVHTDYPA